MSRRAYWYRAWYGVPHLSLHISTRGARRRCIPCILLCARWYALPAFLPARRPFFSSRVGSLCEYRAREFTYIYTCDPTEASERKFLHAICRAAAYFGAHSDRRFAVDLSVTEARRGPLIWKYLVTVIKDTLGWTPSPFHCIDQGIFEERRSLLVDEPKRNDFIRE